VLVVVAAEVFLSKGLLQGHWGEVHLGRSEDFIQVDGWLWLLILFEVNQFSAS
jgi:hypothetical protein